MKSNIKSILALCLVLVMIVSVFTSCGKKEETPEKDSGLIITEAQIKEKLSETDGKLTIQGSSDNVTSFTYVVTGIDASNLSDKTYTKKAVNTLMTDSSKLTYGQLKVCNGFSAVMSVCGLLNNDDSNFDADAFVDEILSIICDGETKTYENWTVSATINFDEDSITVSAISK